MAHLFTPRTHLPSPNLPRTTAWHAAAQAPAVAQVSTQVQSRMEKLAPAQTHPAARAWVAAWALALAGWVPMGSAQAQATWVQTPYESPKALVDVYLDHPDKMGSALYWLRSLVNPLIEAPYSLMPEDMHVIVLLHGTELVTVAKKNEARYEDAVARMRYYASQGVTFKVCGLAMKDYGYRLEDMQPFIQVTPSAMTELVHWQNRGYALMTPMVTDKKVAIDDIR
jgi:uncharacterized protein